ncbi:hypothetical protein ACLOJK_039752 [Asimina triloba]
MGGTEGSENVPTMAAARKLVSNHNALCYLEKCYSMTQLLQIHAQMIATGLVLDTFNASNLLLFCALSDSGDIRYAHSIFRRIPNPNLFIYNTMIRGSALSPSPKDSIFLYSQMLERGISPDNHTFPFVLKACGRIRDLHLGKTVHGVLVKVALESDSFIRSSLINMYANCRLVDSACQLLDNMSDFNVVSFNAMMAGYLKVGDLASALRLFDKMPERDLTSWSIVIAGCVQVGDSKKALQLFTQMRELGIVGDEVILASLLSASAQLGALYRGKCFHAYLYRSHVKLDVVLCTSLVDMYSKCGGIEIALGVFQLMAEKDTLAWNAIITGLAVNGCGEKSLGIFLEMQREGGRPDDVTFIGVLCACSHAGLLDEGFRYFDCMTREYRIKPRIEHYGCMVDLLGRAGRFGDAQDFIKRMPIEPNAAVWGALLGGCIVHGNIVLGEYVGRLLIELEPRHSGRYILLSNLYANANRWDDVQKIREIMKEKGVQKIPGESQIEATGVVHKFFMGDRSHPQTKAIYHMLDEISKQLLLAGYKPDTSKVLLNLDEEDKEHALGYHSEKLAIAFGLISLAPNTPIRIVKNLRVCVDCHTVTKLISKIYSRKIIVRDRSQRSVGLYLDLTCTYLDCYGASLVEES